MLGVFFVVVVVVIFVFILFVRSFIMFMVLAVSTIFAVSMILAMSMTLIVVFGFVVVVVCFLVTDVPRSTAPWGLGVVFVLVLIPASFASFVVVCVSTAPLKVGHCLSFLCDSTLQVWALSLSLELVAPRFCVPRGFISQGKLGRHP